jgi:hypothetical protein
MKHFASCFQSCIFLSGLNGSSDAAPYRLALNEASAAMLVPALLYLFTASFEPCFESNRMYLYS